MPEKLLSFLKSSLFENLALLIVITIIILVVMRFVKQTISKRINDTDNKYRARKAANIFGYVLIAACVLFVYSDKLGNIGITLGLASAGIALALQEVITSFAGWISILFTSQIKIGQRVKIGDLTGDIIDIGVLKTTLMEVGDWVNGDLYNGRITTISNSFVFKNPIQNYSADYPFLWDEIEIPIRTESDYKRARLVFEQVTANVCGNFAKSSQETWEAMSDKFRVENARVNPMISLKFDENWITFTIRYVVDYRNRRSTKDQLFTAILDALAKEENIAIGTSTLEVTSTE